MESTGAKYIGLTSHKDVKDSRLSGEINRSQKSVQFSRTATLLASQQDATGEQMESNWAALIQVGC